MAINLVTTISRFITPDAVTKIALALGIDRGAVEQAVAAGIPAILMMQAPAGSWSNFWTLFGTSNQLLAALTLLGVTVWLYRTSRRYWFTLIPMLFVMTITFWSLTSQIRAAVSRAIEEGFALNTGLFNGVTAIALSLLAVLVIVEAYRSVRRAPRGRSTQADVFAPEVSQ